MNNNIQYSEKIKEKIKYLKEYKQWLNNCHSKDYCTDTHEKLHYSMLSGVVMTRNKPLKIMNNSNLPLTSEPVIFAVNHSNCHDFPTVSEVVKRHFYILADCTMKKDFMVNTLNVLNGCVYVDRLSSESSANSKEELIKILKKGKSLLLFPEATWNLEASLLMLPMKWGIIDISKETNVPIIPITLHYTDNEYIANIGEKMYFDSDKTKKDCIDELRDTMASLRWDILETLPIQKRDKLEEYYWGKYVKKTIDEYKNFDLEYEQSVIFKDKKIIKSEDAYEHLKRIKINKNNVFLLKGSRM